MTYTWTTAGDCDILAVNGNLDSNSAPAVGQQLDEYGSGSPRTLVLDCSGLEYISSAGLRVVIKANQKQAAAGRKLILCGLQEYVREVFDMAGLGKLLDIRPDRQAALS